MAIKKAKQDQDAKDEIAVLQQWQSLATQEAKLTKARDLKQGMVQQLLTGRIRLL